MAAPIPPVNVSLFKHQDVPLNFDISDTLQCSQKEHSIDQMELAFPIPLGATLYFNEQSTKTKSRQNAGTFKARLNEIKKRDWFLQFTSVERVSFDFTLSKVDRVASATVYPSTRESKDAHSARLQFTLNLKEGPYSAINFKIQSCQKMVYTLDKADYSQPSDGEAVKSNLVEHSTPDLFPNSPDSTKDLFEGY